jgi:D-lyxose ketol-isomerase
MINKEEYENARKKAVEYFKKAGIVLTAEEKNFIEVADFGLGDLETIGLEVMVYINTSRVCAKELVMFPGQTWGVKSDGFKSIFFHNIYA